MSNKVKLLDRADIAFIKNVILNAGKMASDYKKSGLDIVRKIDSTIVTQADEGVQDYICEQIKSRFPDTKFICEEKGLRESDPFSGDGFVAAIDPIDGTATYTMFLPFWCVSVGLFFEGKPAYGFIYSPESNLFFYNDNDAAYLNDQKLVVDKNIIIDRETNIFYASNYHRRYDFVFPGKIRNFGSTALHAALLADNARNRGLAFIGKSYLWDWGGALPILLKAGGNVKYIDGSEVNYLDLEENNFKFKKDLVAYTIDDFEYIKNIFQERANYPHC